MMRKATVIAVTGGKKSGKTTTIEILVKEFAKKGYNVATVKHISEADFTIDTAGKDTWRYAQAGAKTVVAVSLNEMAIIEKMSKKAYTLRDILRKCRKSDIIFLEGFRNLIARNARIYKIVPVKTADEAVEAAAIFNPIIAYAGPYDPERLHLQAPYVDMLKNPERLVKIIENLE